MSGVFERSPRLSRLRLPRALSDELCAEATATPEREVCGLLGGRGELATTRYSLPNVDPDPATGFFIDPRAQLHAMRRMREAGETLLGIYHSHPRGPAEPSARDRALAGYPGVAYLIVSLAKHEAPTLRGFVFDGADFAPLRLEYL